MTEITKQHPQESGGSLQLLPNLIAGAIIGVIIGVIMVFIALSFAALIFSGDLAPYISRGIGLALMGTIIIGLIIAAFTSLPGTIGGSNLFACVSRRIGTGFLCPQSRCRLIVILFGAQLPLRLGVYRLFKLPKIDYAIVLVILFVTIAVGFLEAVALGLLLAVIMFVISYSRIDVVRHELSGESYQSRVIRSRQQEQLLLREGKRLYILQLQGFIFFGTANNLLKQIRERVNDPNREKPEFVVLDFQRVAGLDSTAMLSFTRMKQLTESEKFTLLFTQPNERVANQLKQNELVDENIVYIFPTLDQGVETCENQLLVEANVPLDELPPPLAQQLQEILVTQVAALRESPLQADVCLEDFLTHLEKMDVEAGQIAYAALDVTDPEPLPAGHKLLTLPNCLVAPHIASATVASRTLMAQMAVRNCIAGVRGELLPYAVELT